MEQKINREYLRECFDYDADRGLLIWKNRPESHFATQRGWKVFNKRFPGAVAGRLKCWTNKKDRYWYVGLNRRLFYLHRLVWIWHHDEPPEMIDHINRDSTDNRLENLRATNKKENLRNSHHWESRPYYEGITWIEKRQHYQVAVYIDGRERYLGISRDYLGACCIRKSAENRLSL